MATKITIEIQINNLTNEFNECQALNEFFFKSARANEIRDKIEFLEKLLYLEGQ